MSATEGQKGYSKGYNAGRKRRQKEVIDASVRNDRFTTLTATIINAGMVGGWGIETDKGFKKHNADQLAQMAVKIARKMVNDMVVF